VSVLPKLAGSDAEVWQRIVEMAKHKRADVKIHALASLMCMPCPEGEHPGIAPSLGLLHDKDPRVRQQAMVVLERLVPHPEDRARMITLHRIETGRLQERRAAVKALFRSDSLGHPDVIRALAKLLAEQDRGLRLDILHALGQRDASSNSTIAEEHLLAVCGCLADKHAEVRSAALAVIARSRRGFSSADAIARVVPLVQHRDEAVRRDAKAAMRQLMQDEEACKAYTAAARVMQAQASLHDADSSSGATSQLSREAGVSEALDILAQHAMHGGYSALPGLLSCLTSTDGRVRLRAVQALGNDASAESSKEALRGVCNLVADPCVEVRLEANRVLPRMTRALGEECLCCSLIPVLRHRSPEVRRHGLRALAAAAPLGARGAAELARRLLTDSDTEVRNEASRALSHLSAGDSRGSAMVLAIDTIEAARKKLQAADSAGGSSSFKAGAAHILRCSSSSPALPGVGAPGAAQLPKYGAAA